METDNVPSQCDPDLRSQRLDFLTKRLDHTLDHVHKTTQLIYLADGAVLALVGYWLNAFRFEPKSVGMAIVPMFLLLVMNWLHAGFIANQHYWYKIFDKKIRDLLFPDVQNETESEKSTLATDVWLTPKSSHKCLVYIHKAMSFGILILCLLMLAYWRGLISPFIHSGNP